MENIIYFYEVELFSLSLSIILYWNENMRFWDRRCQGEENIWFVFSSKSEHCEKLSKFNQ